MSGRNRNFWHQQWGCFSQFLWTFYSLIHILASETEYGVRWDECVSGTVGSVASRCHCQIRIYIQSASAHGDCIKPRKRIPSVLIRMLQECVFITLRLQMGPTTPGPSETTHPPIHPAGLCVLQFCIQHKSALSVQIFRKKEKHDGKKWITWQSISLQFPELVWCGHKNWLGLVYPGGPEPQFGFCIKPIWFYSEPMIFSINLGRPQVVKMTTQNCKNRG